MLLSRGKIDTSSDKSPLGYQIVYKILPRTQKSGHKDSERRLDFVVRQDLGTGRPIGVAWQTFGYKGPKFHDGFLYGKPNTNLEMTGILWVITDRGGSGLDPNRLR